jgi:hypothetical protein
MAAEGTGAPPTMTTSNLVRWGGGAGVLAAVLFVLSTILNLLAPQQQGVFNSFIDYLYAIILAVAFALPLVVIAGVHALHSGRYGRLGAAGSFITFIGYALISVLIVGSTLVEGEALFAVRLIAAAAILIGSILLGAMILRARVLPWWCGVLLIVGFPLGDVADAVVGEGSEGIVFAILWGLIGYALLSLRDTVAGQPSRVS